MISNTMITISPALDTAAAVREPEMAEAIVNDASTNMISRRTTIPSGVLIMLIIELPPELLPISVLTVPVSAGGISWRHKTCFLHEAVNPDFSSRRSLCSISLLRVIDI
jgi:hypothetical protein